MDLRGWFLEWVNAVADRPDADPLSYQTETGMMLWTALLGILLTTVSGVIIQNHFARKEHERQNKFSDAQYKRQKDDERDEATRRERLTALNLNIKLKIAIDRAGSHLTSWLDCMMITQSNVEMALWQRLIPLSGLPSAPLQFSIDEVALILRAQNIDLANDLLLLNERILSSHDALIEFNRRRSSLDTVLPGDPERSSASFEITNEDAAALAPRFQALQDLATQLCAALIEDLELCMKINELIEPTLRDHFKDPDYKGGSVMNTFRARLSEFSERYEKLRVIGGIGFRRSPDTSSELMNWVTPETAQLLEKFTHLNRTVVS